MLKPTDCTPVRLEQCYDISQQKRDHVKVRQNEMAGPAVVYWSSNHSSGFSQVDVRRHLLLSAVKWSPALTPSRCGGTGSRRGRSLSSTSVWRVCSGDVSSDFLFPTFSLLACIQNKTCIEMGGGRKLFPAVNIFVHRYIGIWMHTKTVVEKRRSLKFYSSVRQCLKAAGLDLSYS